MSKVLALYAPVLHDGYLKFFERHSSADLCAVFGEDMFKLFERVARKDIRAMPPEVIVKMIRALDLFSSVEVLNHQMIDRINHLHPTVVMPDEDESRKVASAYFSKLPVTFEQTFLRWDKTKVSTEKNVFPSGSVREEPISEFMRLALVEAEKSPDWWRQVGAVLATSDEVLAGFNNHVPSPHTPYVFGDPRAAFSKGVAIELSTAEHAEASLIAEAARRGLSTDGAAIYVTTFPCPQCARLIAHSGIKTCYFLTGYSMLDGFEILQRFGVSIVRMVEPPSD